MLQAATLSFLTHYIKVTIVSKYTISFTNLDSKSQLELIGGFYFLHPLH